VLIPAPVLCLACGQHSTRLPRHLDRVHGLDVDTYRERFRAVAPDGVVLVTALTDAVEVVNGRPQLPPGAKRCDGRDADRARQYQRDRRAGRRGSAAPAEVPPIERDPAEEAASAALISRLIGDFYAGRLR
jgi:hypothetical protein